jgi:hypothetical protein
VLIPITTGWATALPAAGAAAVIQAAAGAITWTFANGTPTTVLGYYVVDNVSGLLQWFEPFTVGKVVQNVGDKIIITPTFTLNHV